MSCAAWRNQEVTLKWLYSRDRNSNQPWLPGPDNWCSFLFKTRHISIVYFYSCSQIHKNPNFYLSLLLVECISNILPRTVFDFLSTPLKISSSVEYYVLLAWKCSYCAHGKFFQNLKCTATQGSIGQVDSEHSDWRRKHTLINQIRRLNSIQ